MAEKLPNRPVGGHESDFSELGDWTITDIATAPKTASEDRKNAEAEIARREEAGIYNPDEAPQEVRSDLLSHGYGVENGKVLYPTSKYRSWLESDRTEPIPRGVVRESIEDRLEAERQEAAEAREAMNAERRREFNRAAGEVAIRAFENTPTRERIDHPYRYSSKKDELARERQAEEKARDEEINSRREFKESNKYDNSYSNSEKEAASQARANLPIVEEQTASSERISEVESLDSKAEKMYNVYFEHFSENAPKWLAHGISSAIERGTFNSLPTDSLVASGFWSREQDKIHDKLDPEDTMSYKTIDAESSLKVHVARDLIGEKAGDLSETDIKRAKLKGSLYSIYSGARIDERSRKVVYAIPPERGDEVREFMEQSGIDFGQFGENARARALSYQGFANIIETIKSNNKETERGFKALDWYFDNFGYGKEENIKAFLGTLGSYEETADDAWKTKYNEYLDHRKEVDAFYEAQKKSEAIPVFERENIQEDVSVEDLREKLLTVAESGEDRILPRTSIGRGGRHGGPRAPLEDVTDGAEADQYAYIDAKKLGAIISKHEEYQRLDPDAKLHTVFWTDKNTGKETHYAVLDYTLNGQKVAIIAPYEANSSDAAFDVVGVDWKDVFIASPESKLSVRDREGVKALNHRANMKQGRDGIQNMWFNHEKYVDKAVRGVATA